jgi:hypothetical protein
LVWRSLLCLVRPSLHTQKQQIILFMKSCALRGRAKITSHNLDYPNRIVSVSTAEVLKAPCIGRLWWMQIVAYVV